MIRRPLWLRAWGRVGFVFAGAGLLATLLHVLLWRQPSARSNYTFAEIETLVAQCSAAEALQLLGEPDTKQEAFEGRERWIWWRYTTLHGNDHPPERRGEVVHLAILVQNPEFPENDPPYEDWLIEKPFGVRFFTTYNTLCDRERHVYRHNNEQLVFNGIKARTGRYLIESCTPTQLFQAVAKGQPSIDEDLLDHATKLRQGEMRTVSWVDPKKLDEAGWGVLFPEDDDPRIREALSPLLALRQEQAGNLFRELKYQHGQTKSEFLAQFKVGPGPVDPERLPYYLLLVGSPEQIPFSFQYQLDVAFAVGRLDLETPEDFARYAESVVNAEKKVPSSRGLATFFGVSHNDDRATALTQDYLIEPLANDFELRTRPLGWTVDRVYGGEATKDRLQQILGSPKTQGSFLFTASHGVSFEGDDPQQRDTQGALLCADWPGPEKWSGGVTGDCYFAADDLPQDTKVDGAIIMSFACFSAGTPKIDNFFHRTRRLKDQAPEDFVARLPQRLLGRGALAFIGHVDRAWTFSFYWARGEAQREVFESALACLLQGQPVGAAMDEFGARYAELATMITERQQLLPDSKTPPKDLLSWSSLWTAHNDARSYVVLGDPAVRLSGTQGH